MICLKRKPNSSTTGHKGAFARHTAEYQGKNTLSRYGLSVTQVCNVATDNGANVLKAARLLGETDYETRASSLDKKVDVATYNLHSVALYWTIQRMRSALVLMGQISSLV